MNPSAQYPSLVMIMRHGEKPGDPADDKAGGPNLSVLGSARAAALPSLFTPNPAATAVAAAQELACDLTVGAQGRLTATYASSAIDAGQSRFPAPNFLFATAASKHSNRPAETITPLAQALQVMFNDPSLSINQDFANNAAGIDGLRSEILNKPGTYGGKVILICWHHGTLLQLTKAFGVPSGQLPWPKWPSTVFNLIFSLTWDSSAQVNLAVDRQQLLYGDTATTKQSN